MNKENLLKVASEIERLPHKFNMQSPRSPYGTRCGCLTGFAKGLAAVPDLQRAGEWMGLTNNQERSLSYGGLIWYKYAQELGIPFTTNLRMVKLSDIKPEHAITMLRNLASGKWSFGNDK